MRELMKNTCDDKLMSITNAKRETETRNIVTTEYKIKVHENAKKKKTEYVCQIHHIDALIHTDVLLHP